MTITDDPTCANCGSTSVEGVEVPTVYDGVLFWRCQACRLCWHRFTEKRGRLWMRASEIMQRWQTRWPVLPTIAEKAGALHSDTSLGESKPGAS